MCRSVTLWSSQLKNTAKSRKTDLVISIFFLGGGGGWSAAHIQDQIVLEAKLPKLFLNPFSGQIVLQRHMCMKWLFDTELQLPTAGQNTAPAVTRWNNKKKKKSELKFKDGISVIYAAITVMFLHFFFFFGFLMFAMWSCFGHQGRGSLGLCWFLSIVTHGSFCPGS